MWEKGIVITFYLQVICKNSTFAYNTCKQNKMNLRNHIGEFEEIVMLTIGILNDEAYGLAIKKEIEDRLKRILDENSFQNQIKLE